jgi:hypothetical protein
MSDELDARGWWERAKLAYEEGLFERALEANERALELDPENAVICAQRSWILILLGGSRRRLRSESGRRNSIQRIQMPGTTKVQRLGAADLESIAFHVRG